MIDPDYNTAFFDMENGVVVVIEDGVERQVLPSSVMYSTAVMLAGGECRKKVGGKWVKDI